MRTNEPCRTGPLILAIGDRMPTFHPTAWLAPSASITGSVHLDADASIWYGASVRGDREDIRIGTGSNVQDCCALHADPGFPLTLGSSVSVGHGAVLHGCEIGNHVLIGMSATVLNGAVIGDDSIVAAGALVTEGQRVPPRSLVLGSPARIARPVSDDERARIAQNAADYRALAREHAHGLTYPEETAR